MPRAPADHSFLVDTNVWLALTLSGHVHHELARDWLDGVDGPGSVLFCRSTQQSLLRLLTDPAVLAPYGNAPLTNTEAWAVYDALLADERITLATEEPFGLATQRRTYSLRDSASQKLWTDAYLAAFALAGGRRMVTTDRAFGRFDGLELVLLR